MAVLWADVTRTKMLKQFIFYKQFNKHNNYENKF